MVGSPAWCATRAAHRKREQWSPSPTSQRASRGARSRQPAATTRSPDSNPAPTPSPHRGSASGALHARMCRSPEKPRLTSYSIRWRFRRSSSRRRSASRSSPTCPSRSRPPPRRCCASVAPITSRRSRPTWPDSACRTSDRDKARLRFAEHPRARSRAISRVSRNRRASTWMTHRSPSRCSRRISICSISRAWKCCAGRRVHCSVPDHSPARSGTSPISRSSACAAPSARSGAPGSTAAAGVPTSSLARTRR